MTKGLDESLPAAVQARLRDMQSDLDSIADWAERGVRSQSHFSNRNTSENSTFIIVREKLLKTCFNGRCSYCGRSAVERIDHFRPKRLYPEVTYDWDNMVGSCAACNESKGDRFAVFKTPTGKSYATYPPRRKPIVEQSLLINPRHEEALDFIAMNLDSGGAFLN